MSQATNANKNCHAMYGSVGADMIASLRKAKWLPKYDQDGVNKVIKEIKELNDQITTTLAAAQYQIRDEAIACGVMVHHHALQRNRRILCAYHRWRMNAIEDIRFEKGAALSDYYRNKLDVSEIEYFKEYSTLLTDYMKSTDVQITSNLLPPKDLKQEIAVIEDVGELQTQNGSYNLIKHSRQFVDSTDVEMLIQRGKVVPTQTRPC